jgi:hypothetical protein
MQRIGGFQLLILGVLFFFPCSGESGFVSCDFGYKILALFYGLPISLITDGCLWGYGAAGIRKNWPVIKWIGYSLVTTLMIIAFGVLVLKDILRVMGLGIF